MKDLFTAILPYYGQYWLAIYFMAQQIKVWFFVP